MYPFDFRPKGGFIDTRKIFVAMPFADEYEQVYKDLIEPAVKKTNHSLGEDDQLCLYRAKDPKYTRTGWIEILENLYTARIVIGVLTGDNPNVFYELGIAHATQQIQRQLLIAKNGYKVKFDLKDLIYREYDPQKISASVDDLSDAIMETLKYYDIINDRMVSQAEARISRYELKVMTDFGGREKGHFFIRNDLPEILREEYMTGLTHLCHSALVRASFKPKDHDGKIEYSYYWTDLGNAVLFKLGIIKEETLLNRRKIYWKHFDV
jgi:hypothetical protein